MTTLAVGDVVLCGDSANTCGRLESGKAYTVTKVYDRGEIAVDNIDNNFGWNASRFIKINIVETPPKKTGGSTPNQYRLSVNLPLTSDRTQFVDIDLEAMDVIDALDLSGNLKDVQKALFRMGKKQDTPVAYDLNKCLFYILREMKKRGTISHAKFWEVSGMLDNVLKAEDVK